MTRFSGWWRRVLLGVLAAVLAVGLLIAATHDGSKKTADHASAKRIVAEALKQAGPSRAPIGSFIASLPYNASIPAKLKPVYVGDTIIYENFMSRSSLLARPTATGHEGFIYVAGPEAPKSFLFSFHLLPGTHLEKEPNSSVSVVDTVSKARPTIIKDVKAVNTSDGRLHPATISPVSNSIRLDLNLKSPKYPVVVEFEYMDPTPTLVEGRVPAVKEVRSAETTKTVRPLQSNQGKYYAKETNLVIQLTSASTLQAANYAKGLDKGDNLDSMVRAAMAGAGTDATEALRSAKTNSCLTVTIPQEGLDEFTDRYALVWSGEQAGATESPQPESMSLAVDECEKPPAKAAGKPTPAPKPDNRQRPNPVANSGSSSGSAEPQIINLDMDQLCRNLFGPGASSVALNPNNRDSWACNSASERYAVGQEDMRIYCRYTLSGSYLMAVGVRPSDWRCKTG